MKLTPRNWPEFQHYTGRRPPWIKLHRALLDDRAFHSLQDASRALAPCLWLLASEHPDGEIDANRENLEFRLRRPWEWIENALIPLIASGLFIADSELLASCKQRDSEVLSSSLAVEANSTPTPSQEKRARGRSAKTGLPDDFVVSDRVRAWAKEKGHGRLEEHLEAFKAKVRKSGLQYVDWDAAFEEAVREDWAGLRGKNGNHAAGAPASAWKAGAEPSKVLADAAELLGIDPWQTEAGETHGQFRKRIVDAGGEHLLRGRG